MKNWNHREKHWVEPPEMAENTTGKEWKANENEENAYNRDDKVLIFLI